MTTKKVTTKGSRKGKAEGSDLKTRAHAILENVERYDYDTRHAVHLALRRIEFHSPGGGAEKYTTAEEAHADLPQLERELREVVEKAEAGKPVVSSGVGKEYEEAARRVLGLLYSPGIPDFITNGIYDVLHAAEQVFGVQLWRYEINRVRDEQGGWSVETMARAFAQHPGQTFNLEIQKTLPELISAVLAHKDTPASLYNAFQDALGDLPGFAAAHKTPAYLSELLRLSAETEEGDAR